MTSAEIIALLELDRHPEGGWYRQTFEDTPEAGQRAQSTAIYYLLEGDDNSHWHRVDAAEVWHWYGGAPLRLRLSHEGKVIDEYVLGADLPPGSGRRSWCPGIPGRRRRASATGRWSAAPSRPASSSRDSSWPRRLVTIVARRRRQTGHHPDAAAVDSRPALAFAPAVHSSHYILSVLSAAALAAAWRPRAAAAERLTAAAGEGGRGLRRQQFALLSLPRGRAPADRPAGAARCSARRRTPPTTWRPISCSGRNSPRANRILIDAARGWLLSGDKYDTDFEKSDFYDAHSFDHQRAYQIVCLMVGRDAKLFGDVADDYGIDAERQESCAWDYDLVERSMEACSRRNGRSRTRASRPGPDRLFARSTTTDSAWRPTSSSGSGAFEQIAQELRSSYTLPKTVTLRARACGGDANAYYDADEVEVIFCYELMADLLTLIAGKLPEDTRSSDHVGRTGSRLYGLTGTEKPSIIVRSPISASITAASCPGR